MERTQTYVASDPSIAKSITHGLALHKMMLGKPHCPCRFYPDKEEAAKERFRNCLGVPMREEKKCHACCSSRRTASSVELGPDVPDTVISKAGRMK